MSTVETVYIPDTVASLQPPRPKPSLDDSGWARIELEDVPKSVSETCNILRGFLTATDIAEFLRSYGAKGDRGILKSCPLSNFAAASAPDATLIETDINGCRLTIGGLSFKIEATPALTEFVQNFDNGHYPDLVS